MLSDLTPEELAAHLAAGEAFELIDVREPKEFALVRLRGSRLIPMRELPGRMVEIDWTLPVVMICHSGNRSRAMALVADAPERMVSNLRGGIMACYRNGQKDMLEIDGDVTGYC
jgi:sulfur-carrier protein adenylyltransferase/sulfurtransferase